MVIEVIGKKVVKYEITCTDTSCNNIIRFDSTDVRTVNRSSMGRVIGSVQGIGCPDCNQVLPVADATIIGRVDIEDPVDQAALEEAE